MQNQKICNFVRFWKLDPIENYLVYHCGIKYSYYFSKFRASIFGIGLYFSNVRI